MSAASTKGSAECSWGSLGPLTGGAYSPMFELSSRTTLAWTHRECNDLGIPTPFPTAGIPGDHRCPGFTSVCRGLPALSHPDFGRILRLARRV